MKKDSEEQQKLKQLATQLASGLFLTKRYPKTWKSMSDEELHDFIEKNTYEPYKGQPVKLIEENIRLLSGDFMRFGEYYSHNDEDAYKISVTLD